MPILSTQQAKAFYDRFGTRQDGQSFYEDAATDDLIAYADFAAAQSIFEFGCGTGRFAAGLLARHLPADAAYLGIDVSTTMIELARTSLAPWHERVEVRTSSGSMDLEIPDGVYDRFVSNFVLDLLSENDIRHLLAEAHRILISGGYLCLTGLTPGATVPSRVVSSLWRIVHRLHPSLVGGCRPLNIVDRLGQDRWQVRHQRVVTSFAISCEVVIAARRP